MHESAHKRVVVTGGAGYIGSVLTETLLEAGYHVIVLDRFFFGDTLKHLAGNKNLTLVRGDIRTVSAQLFKGVYAVMDLAALSNDPAGELDPENTFDINHKGRARICKLAEEAGVERYILASSCSLYGFQDELVDEDSDLNPLTTYALANRQAEIDCLARVGGSMSITVLRQATVYGPSPRMRFELAVNGVTHALYTTGVAKLQREGLQWRPMVHIRDTARAFLMVLESDRTVVDGHIFNVGPEDNVQLLPLSERIAAEVGVPLEIEWWGDPDFRSYRVSFKKIATVLGYQTRYTIEDGVRDIVARLKEGSLKNELVNNTVKWYVHLLESDPNALAASEEEHEEE